MNWPLEEKKKAESIFRKLVFDGLGDALCEKQWLRQQRLRYDFESREGNVRTLDLFGFFEVFFQALNLHTA